MRVVGWNLGYAFGFKTTHDRAWDWLKEFDPDLAMLQEVRPELAEWVHERWTVVRRRPKYSGSLILAKPELGLRELSGEHPRFKGSDAYLAAGTVTLPDGTELLVGTVHTPIGKATVDELFGYDPEAIRRPRDFGPKGEIGPRRNDVAYAYYRDTVRRRRFLVSGDWSIARLWDYQYRRPPRTRWTSSTAPRPTAGRSATACSIPRGKVGRGSATPSRRTRWTTPSATRRPRRPCGLATSTPVRPSFSSSAITPR